MSVGRVNVSEERVYLPVMVSLEVDLSPSLNPFHGEASGESIVKRQLLPAILVQCALNKSPAIALADVVGLGRGGLGGGSVRSGGSAGLLLLCGGNALATHDGGVGL
jgi:hypothetical protein